MNIPEKYRFLWIGIFTLNESFMRQKTWTKVAAIVLAALLLWWLFWAILADEDMNSMELENTEIVE